MKKPVKYISNVDLSNNKIYNVPEILGPSYTDDSVSKDLTIRPGDATSASGTAGDLYLIPGKASGTHASGSIYIQQEKSEDATDAAVLGVKINPSKAIIARTPAGQNITVGAGTSNQVLFESNQNATAASSSNGSAVFAGGIRVQKDIIFSGGNLDSSTSSQNLFNTPTGTITAFQKAATLKIGNASSSNTLTGNVNTLIDKNLVIDSSVTSTIKGVTVFSGGTVSSSQPADLDINSTSVSFAPNSIHALNLLKHASTSADAADNLGEGSLFYRNQAATHTYDGLLFQDPNAGLLRIGQDEYQKVVAGTAITKGQAVYVRSTSSNELTVYPVDVLNEDKTVVDINPLNTGSTPGAEDITYISFENKHILGVAFENIAAGKHGYIQTRGVFPLASLKKDTTFAIANRNGLYAGLSGSFTTDPTSLSASGISEIRTIKCGYIASSNYIYIDIDSSGRTYSNSGISEGKSSLNVSSINTNNVQAQYPDKDVFLYSQYVGSKSHIRAFTDTTSTVEVFDTVGNHNIHIAGDVTVGSKSYKGSGTPILERTVDIYGDANIWTRSDAKIDGSNWTGVSIKMNPTLNALQFLRV